MELEAVATFATSAVIAPFAVGACVAGLGLLLTSAVAASTGVLMLVISAVCTMVLLRAYRDPERRRAARYGSLAGIGVGALLGGRLLRLAAHSPRRPPVTDDHEPCSVDG